MEKQLSWVLKLLFSEQPMVSHDFPTKPGNQAWNCLYKNLFVLNRDGSKVASDEVDRWSEGFVEPRSDRVNILSGFDFSRSLGKQKLSVSPVFCFIQESDGEVLHRRQNVGIHQRSDSFWQDTSAAWFKSQLVLKSIARPYTTKLNDHTYL